MITAEELAKFPDTFNGDDAHLVRCIEALLSLDATGTLVPHGIGGHARGLLSAAMHRLATQSRAAVRSPGCDFPGCPLDGAPSHRHLATPQPPNTIRVDVEQIGSCELDVRDGVAYMPAVTVQDIVSKSCLKPQPPKDAGEVPLPQSPLPYCEWNSLELDAIHQYGNAREAAALSDAEKAEQYRKGWEAGEDAGRADAVPLLDTFAERLADAISLIDLSATNIPVLAQADKELRALYRDMKAKPQALSQSPPAEPAARAQAAVGGGLVAVAYTDPENIADGSHPSDWEMYQPGEQSRGDIALCIHPSPAHAGAGDAEEFTSDAREWRLKARGELERAVARYDDCLSQPGKNTAAAELVGIARRLAGGDHANW